MASRSEGSEDEDEEGEVESLLSGGRNGILVR